MQVPSCKQSPTKAPCRIYFPQHVFGKPTKNRQEDPNMFELLTWSTDGFERHAFKKDQKFQEPTDAYLNMIGKQPWASEAQESYVNYHSNCVDANEEVLNKIENYIQDRKPQVRSPSKGKKLEKKAGVPQSKKENKYNVHHYLSPKVQGKTEQNVQPSNMKKVSAQQLKSHKQLNSKADLRQDAKYDIQHKQMNNKSYAMDKSKFQTKDYSQNDQEKMIQKFKQTTRWIPNSAFTTYFGKPPFENYGRGNTKPVDGGLIYGTYLYSHNVHPHRGKNQPHHTQSYPVALSKAKSMGTLVPTYPRTKPEESYVAEEQRERGRIEPEINNFVGGLDIERPRLEDMQKFGGKRKSRVTTQIPKY